MRSLFFFCRWKLHSRRNCFGFRRLPTARSHIVKWVGLQSQKMTYTPWNRVLLEKLIVVQKVKKFLAFYITWMCITVFTTARHWTLSWATLTQSRLLPHTYSYLKNHINILPSTPRSPKWSLSFRFSIYKFICIFRFLYMPICPFISSSFIW
jgi:hypothetical protein